jgi:hypothetical protein
VSSASDAADAEDALDSHWQAINDHHFNTAYGYLDPVDAPSESGWVQSHEDAGIREAIINTQPGRVTGDTATVQVSSLVTIEGCGRKDWGSSYYDMVRRNGRWYIDKSHWVSPPCR